MTNEPKAASPPTELEAALGRALDPDRLLARIAAHAHSKSPTAWRSAAWLLTWQRDRVEALAVPAADDPFAELDELAERRMRHRRRLGAPATGSSASTSSGGSRQSTKSQATEMSN